MELPQGIFFCLNRVKNIVDDTPEYELYTVTGNEVKAEDRDMEIVASLRIRLDHRGELALAIFSAEESELAADGLDSAMNTIGFAFKYLLTEAFIAGAKFGRKKPDIKL